MEKRFESRILPLFVRRIKGVADLLPKLYRHGLAEGDFDLALGGLLGEEAPLSASTVVCLKSKGEAEWEAWRKQPPDGLEAVYLWVDGVYVKAGLEKEMLGKIVCAKSRAEAERRRREFEDWCRSRGYMKAAETLGRDWERMLTFYRYPKEHWVHIRTANVVESPFAALRLRTDAAKR